MLSEKPFTHGNILVPAIPIGGLRMIDGRQADEITHVYGRDEAYQVIRRSHEDYLSRYAGIDEMITAVLRT